MTRWLLVSICRIRIENTNWHDIAGDIVDWQYSREFSWKVSRQNLIVATEILYTCTPHYDIVTVAFTAWLASSFSMFEYSQEIFFFHFLWIKIESIDVLRGQDINGKITKINRSMMSYRIVSTKFIFTRNIETHPLAAAILYPGWRTGAVQFGRYFNGTAANNTNLTTILFGGGKSINREARFRTNDFQYVYPCFFSSHHHYRGVYISLKSAQRNINR